MSIEVKTIRTDSFEMQYFSFGTGEKTMVILPGLSIKSVMLSAPAIEAAYEIFTGKYTVYVFDRRSDLPEQYNVRDMAEDTAAAMDVLRITGAYLFGISQGGMIAQIIAAQRPELVRKLFLGSTAARIDTDAAGKLAEWVRCAESGNAHELVMSFAELVYPGEYIDKYRSAFEALADSVDDEDMYRFTILAAGTENFSIYDDLALIKCPVLAVGDRDDRIFGAKSTEDIADKLGCEMFLYEGYGHAVYDEAPDYKTRTFEFFEK